LAIRAEGANVAVAPAQVSRRVEDERAVLSERFTDTQIGTLNAIYSFPNIVMVLVGSGGGGMCVCGGGDYRPVLERRAGGNPMISVGPSRACRSSHIILAGGDQDAAMQSVVPLPIRREGCEIDTRDSRSPPDGSVGARNRARVLPSSGLKPKEQVCLR
jgi:hypothetical protein